MADAEDLVWTSELVDELLKCVNEKLTGAKIAQHLSMKFKMVVSRNAVIGKVRRISKATNVELHIGTMPRVGQRKRIRGPKLHSKTLSVFEKIKQLEKPRHCPTPSKHTKH